MHRTSLRLATSRMSELTKGGGKKRLINAIVRKESKGSDGVGAYVPLACSRHFAAFTPITRSQRVKESSPNPLIGIM